MRKCNAILTGLILALFLAHGVLGSFQMLGVSNGPLKALSWIMAALVAVHTCIGVKLTADTVKAQKKTGAAYFRENTLFWARRVSGFAVMAFLLLLFMAAAFVVYYLRWNVL